MGLKFDLQKRAMDVEISIHTRKPDAAGNWEVDFPGYARQSVVMAPAAYGEITNLSEVVVPLDGSVPLPCYVGLWESGELIGTAGVDVAVDPDGRLQLKMSGVEITELGWQRVLGVFMGAGKWEG